MNGISVLFLIGLISGGFALRGGGSFGLPKGCTSAVDCLVEFSWQPRQSSSDPVSANLRAKPDPSYNGLFWTAVGFAPEHKMGGAAVVECVSWNNTNGELHNDLFGSFNLVNNTNTRTGNDGLTLVSSGFENGYLTCSFTIDVVREITVDPENQLKVDLTQDYYLLLARGRMENANGNEKHPHDQKLVSDDQFVVANTPVVRNEVYDECGKSRRCFGVPDGCIDNGTCTQLLSYGAAEGGKSIPVDLYGTAPSQEFSDSFWVGFGNSISGGMANTSVVQCALYPNASVPVVVAAYNANPSYAPLPDRHTGIKFASGSVRNGYIRCSFNLDLARTVSDPGRNVAPLLFDLSTPYTLLLANGKCVNDTDPKNPYKPGAHLTRPWKSDQPIVMSCGNNCVCSKGNCFGVPENCEDTHTCDLLFSWSNSKSKDYVTVTLSGTAPSTKYADGFWVGFGVSKKGRMANTAVVQCVRYTNGTNGVITAYNFPKYTYIPWDDAQYGLKDITTSFSDGRVTCTFDVAVKRTFYTEDFDLTEYYYLVLGSGAVKDDGTIKKHKGKPRVSDNQIALACSSNCIAPTTPPVTTTPPATIGHFEFPAGCEGADCVVKLTFSPSSSHSDRVALTLQGPPVTNGQGFYLAVGFNAEKAKMATAMVLECFINATGHLTLGSSYNSVADGRYQNSPTPGNGLHYISGSTDKGIATCSFEVDVVRTVAGFNDTYDLKNNQYYLLLAKGPLTEAGLKDYHGANKIVSADKVQIFNGGDVVGDRKLMQKIHAVMMILAWLWCAKCGILNARQTKNMWADKEPCGTKMWFFLHRMDMIQCVMLSVAAIVVIFVHNAGWVDIPHAYLGMITFILSLIQPTLAAFRPHPGTPRRPYFNYVHWTLGYSALALSGVTMFLGMQRLGTQRHSEYVIVATFLVNIVLQIVLEVYKARAAGRFGTTESKEDLWNSVEQESTSRPVRGPDGLYPDDRVRSTIVYLDWALVTIGSAVAIAFTVMA